MRHSDCGRAMRTLGSAVILLAIAGQATAGTVWDGGGANNDWGTVANWNPDGVPLNNGTAVIEMAGPTRPTPNVNVPWSIQALVFDPGTAAFTVGGSTLTINSSVGVQNQSTNLQTVNAPITLAVASHFDALNADLTVGGAVNNGGFLLTVWGTHDTIVSGAISGNGGLTKTENGTLTLSGGSANVYIGTTTVSQGTLVLDKSVADGAIAKDLVIGDGIGTDTVRLNRANQISNSVGNTVTINSSGVLDLNGYAESIYNLTMTGGGQVTGAGGSSLSVAGTVTTNASGASATISSGLVLNTAGQISFVVADGGAGYDLDVSGKVDSLGGGGMVKSGAGTMRLSGGSANTFLGTTTVNEGVLVLNKTAGGVDSIAHDLVIGDGVGGAGADVVRLWTANQINDASNVTITSSGLLGLNDFNDTIGLLTMNSGSVTTGVGTLGLGGKVTTYAHASSATISGNVNLNAPDREFDVSDGPAAVDLDVSAVLSGGGLVKTGNGTLRLGGASPNTYAGTTTVSAGTLQLAKTGGTVAVPGNLTITGGTVELAQNDQITEAGGTTVTITSGGLLNLGGWSDIINNLDMTAGSVQTAAGVLRIGGNVTTHASAATASINGNVNLDGTIVSFDIADGAAAPDMDIYGIISNGGVEKTGAGTLRFSGPSNNIYGAYTSVSQGTLELAKTGGLWAVSGDLYVNTGGTVKLSGGNNEISPGQTTAINGGTLDLNGYTQTLATLHMTGGSVTTGAGTLTVGSGSITTYASATSATIAGNLNLGGATRTFTVAEGGATYDLDVSAAISNGGITKTGPGTLRFSGTSANTYTGATTVNDGTLVLDKSGIDGAIAKDLVIGDGTGTDTVRLNQNNQISHSAGNTVTINSSGVLDVNGHADVIYNLTMTGGGQVVGTGGGALYVQATVTTNASAATATISSVLVLVMAGQIPFVIAEGAAGVDLDVSGSLSSTGGGGMVKSGAGTMQLSGAAPNTFTGTATVNEGVLLLTKTPGADAIPHDLVIGDGLGGAGTDVVRLVASDQINDASNVTVTSSGLLDLSVYSDVIGPLTMTSGSVTTGAGTLWLGGKVTTNAHAASATISGNVNLGVPDREFNVAEGAAPYDLDVSAVLSGGGLVKTGPGTLRLSGSGANIHTGTTTVNEGTLVLDKSVVDGAIAKDLVIGDGVGTDTVRLNQSNQISQASGNTVTINSSGVLDLNAHTEAIRNLTMTGGGQLIGSGFSYLYVLGTVTTNASSATATISCAGLLLDVAGQVPFVIADGAAAVDLDVSGSLYSATGSEGLVKSGAGTMRLSGSSANTYDGTTTVTAGTLLLAKTAGVNAVAGNLVIGDEAGGYDSDVVRLAANSQITAAAGVTMHYAGLLDLAGYIEAIGNLTMESGHVVTGAGALEVMGMVSGLASNVTAYIEGNLSLSGEREFNIQDGSAAPDMVVSAVLSNGSLKKTGTGTLRLGGSASNTYTGTTTVNEGTLELAKTGAALAISGDLIVNNGATVQLSASNQIADSQTTTINTGGTLDLGSSGDGIANLVLNGGTVTGGAAGTLNVWASPATIQAAPGPATISANVNLLVGATGPGTILKTGALATLTLGADSTIGGATVEAGTLATGSAILTIPLGGTYSQTGGIFSGILRSQGTFSYTAGTFSGRLINESDLSIPASFTAGNGVQNFATITRTTGQSLTSNGAGLDNQGEIILAGGTLDGGGPITNGASIFGYGTIGGAGGFANSAILTVIGGNLTISKTGTNANVGTIDVQSGRQLRLTGGNLSNVGRIDLAGGVVAGTATLSNNAGGAVVGRGTISSPFANNGGLLRAEGGAINVTAAFASTGLIELESGSGLAGGTITNTGTIQGAGSIANAITNNGRIEAVGGTIILGGAVTNAVGGTIEANAGDRVFIGGGLAANAGIISLNGGTFDNNGLALDNTGQISGRGTLQTGALTNHGGIGFSAGITDVYGDVTNPSGGRIIVTGGGTATFFDDVVHDAGATFQVSSGCSVVLFGLSGTGSFSGTGTVYMEGDLRPGHSPGSVSFDGDLVLGGDADLMAELGGTSLGLQYDHVSVGSRLDAGGSLEVVLINGFQPHVGDTFDLLDWGTLSGGFDSVALPALGGSLAWDASALYDTGTLRVTPEPATLALLALGGLGLLGRRRRT